MTALAQEKMSSMERWTHKVFTLTSGTKAYKGAQCVLVLATSKVKPGVAGSGLVMIGTFDQTVDAAAGDLPVNVNLGMEIEVIWWVNSGTSPVAATDILALCYVEDDQTVSLAPASTGAPVSGRVWAVDTIKGVAVQKLAQVAVGSGGGGRLAEVALTAFSSNNINVADNPASGNIYDVPATGAGSTVTLPAAATEGSVLYFVADGTKNGHAVTYRDATGPVSLTTALTASKRHLVVATFLNGLWNANAYVGP